MSITLAQAEKLINTAKEKALVLHCHVNIAVVDASGNLVVFARMDGSWLGGIDIAIKKAKTAFNFGKNTDILAKRSQPKGPVYAIDHSNGGLITASGGMPIKNCDDTIIGGVGVSGSSVENDLTVAGAGVKAM